MKILIAGEKNYFNLEITLERALQRAGCDVLLWGSRERKWYSGFQDWWTLHPLIRSVYNVMASMEFYRTAIRYRPDILFIPKAENIHSHAARRAMEKTGSRLVIWYPDNPFKADMTSMNVLRNLKRCEIFYIWGKFLVEPLKAAGCPNVQYLPFAFDPKMHSSDAPLTDEDRKRFSADITFVGTWDKEREKDLEPLAEFDLAIWGPGWTRNLHSKSPLRPRIRGEGLYNEEQARAYRCSRLVFNHLRLQNGSAHNMRTMEICGVGGGVQVVRRTPEQAQELFRENEHLLCFEGTDELRKTVTSALANSERCREMSSKAKKHVFEKHLMDFRVKQIIEDLREKSTFISP